MKIEGKINSDGEATITFPLANMGWGTPALNVEALSELRDVVADLLEQLCAVAVTARG